MDEKKIMVPQSAMPETNSRFDFLRWFSIVVLLVAVIIAGFYYNRAMLAIRMAIGIVVVIVLLAIVLKTNKGRKAFSFVKSARAELRKVVWPTRQETFQTTMVVVVMVVITTLILWGIDGFFIQVIGWMTGQRG